MKNYFVKSKVVSSIQEYQNEEKELIQDALVNGSFNHAVRKQIQKVRNLIEWENSKLQMAR